MWAVDQVAHAIMDSVNAVGRFFSRTRRRASTAKQDRGLDDATRSGLGDFIKQRRGVEGWVESATRFNKPSLLLIAYDGEWIRRSIPSAAWAFVFCAKHDIPAFQAGVVPEPQRQRERGARKSRVGVLAACSVVRPPRLSRGHPAMPSATRKAVFDIR